MINSKNLSSKIYLLKQSPSSTQQQLNALNFLAYLVFRYKIIFEIKDDPALYIQLAEECEKEKGKENEEILFRISFSLFRTKHKDQFDYCWAPSPLEREMYNHIFKTSDLE